MELFVRLIFFLIGICCGSFVNMLVYRTEIRYKLKNLKLKHQNNNERSFCDFCGKQLNWYDNIPVISWIWLGGKSRCCRKKLSWYYPLVELITGILFALMGNNYLGMVIITLLVFAAVFDMKHMILPDFSTYILIGMTVVLLMGGHGGPPLQNIIAGAGSFLFLLFLHLVTKGKGMGMGDVKYAMFMGLLLGWPKIVLAFYIAFIGGALVGVALVIVGKYRRKSKMPFGPFLIGGTIVSWWWGNGILLYLYRWF